MAHDEVAFEVSSEPTAAGQARARLADLETLGPNRLAAVKTIVRLLVTRAMREGDGGPFAIRVSGDSLGASGSVRSPNGWSSLRAAPLVGTSDNCAVLNAFASSWRIEQESVCFSVS